MTAVHFKSTRYDVKSLAILAYVRIHDSHFRELRLIFTVLLDKEAAMRGNLCPLIQAPSRKLLTHLPAKQLK